MKGPWWRWFNFRRRRKTHQHTVKPWNAIVFVASLVTLDQVSKSLLTTQDWAWHDQPRTWLISVAIGTLLGSILLLTPAAPSGILLIAGAIGNGMSEAIHDTIANPFQAQYGLHIIAFNTADAYLALAPIACVFGIVTSVVRFVNTSPEAAT